jgi:hypothetical protein
VKKQELYFISTSHNRRKISVQDTLKTIFDIMRKAEWVSKKVNRAENFERLIFNTSSDKDSEIVLVCRDIFVVIFYVKSVNIYPEK